MSSPPVPNTPSIPLHHSLDIGPFESIMANFISIRLFQHPRRFHIGLVHRSIGGVGNVRAFDLIQFDRNSTGHCNDLLKASYDFACLGLFQEIPMTGFPPTMAWASCP